MRRLPNVVLALSVLSSFAAVGGTQSQFATGGDVTIVNVGTEAVHKFDAAGEYTFTLDSAQQVWFLVVGGGGASGRDCSGGGGAGGFVESNSVALAAGSYTVTVGAGGQPQSGQGNDGGDSVISIGGVDVARAKGGGGGGSYANHPGRPGGSGGGGTTGGSGGAGVAGQGNAGGDTSGNCTAGGGGAGGPAPACTHGDKSAGGGPGGPGKASSITGTEIYYAGGGGGGGWNCNVFEKQQNGGIGGGGNGVRNVEIATRQGVILADGRTEYEAECGVDGLGGGGGGANNKELTGRPGGCGCVIIRLSNVDPSSPNPVVALGEQSGSTYTSVTFSATLVTAGSGRDGETVALSAEYSDNLADFGTTPFTGSTVVLSPAFSGTRTFFIGGLAGANGGKTYYVRLVAENAGNYVWRSEAAAIRTAPFALSSQYAEGGEVTFFENGSKAVHDFSGVGDHTFTLIMEQEVWFLVVGGGGAGGYDCAGGGGAGGFVESNSVTLAAGTYTVTVGAGGQPSSNNTSNGGKGGDSAITIGGVDVARAIGGGGGRSWAASSVANGGSGGGGTNSKSGGGATAGQGNAGGTTTANSKPSGGGGAGAAGGSSDGSVAGVGGDGLASSITGTEVYYAGGGGGGGYGITPGAGGLGGGGNGVRNVAVSERKGVGTADGRTEYEAECGVDGLGGGGGGGNNTDYKGRPGGSGRVVIRLSNVAQTNPEPFANFAVADYGAKFVHFSGHIVAVGNGASECDVLVKVWPTADVEPVGWTTLQSGLAATPFSHKVTGLSPETAYSFKIKAVNDNALDSAITSGTFTTTAAGGAAPEITLDSAEYNEENFTGDVAYRVAWAGAGYETADVKVAWGYSPDLLVHTNDIANGVIGSGSGSFALVADDCAVYVRALAVNGGGASAASDTLSIYVGPNANGGSDPALPVLSNVGFPHVDGIYAVVTGVVASVGSAAQTPATCVVRAMVGTTAGALSDWAEGRFEKGLFTLNLTNLAAATEYLGAMVAVDDAGMSVALGAQSFTTIAASALSDISTSVSKRNFTISGSVATLGAGTTHVFARWGDGEWTRIGTFDRNSASRSFSSTYAGTWGETTTWRILCSNECETVEGVPNGQFYVSEKTGALSPKDNATYTWKAVNGDWNGDWNDPAHWTSSAGDCLGYPDNASCSATFTGCTLANPVMVNVNGNFATDRIIFWGANGSKIIFAGRGAETSGLQSVYSQSAIAANSEVEFRDMALTMKGDWELLRASNDNGKTNVTFRLNRVRATAKGYFSMSAGYCHMELIDSVVTGTTKINIGGRGTFFVVDNTKITATSSGMFFNADINSLYRDEPTMVIRGAGTAITTPSFYIYSHSNGTNANVVVEVPVDGFRTTPLTVSGKLASGGSSTAKFVFSVSPRSPALRKSTRRLENQVIVSAGSGFETGKVVFDAVPEHNGKSCGELFYGRDGAPLAEGSALSNARQILLNLKGYSAPTMFVVY